MKRWYLVIVYFTDGTSRRFVHQFRNEITAMREVTKWLQTERNSHLSTWTIYRVDIHPCDPPNVSIS